MSQPDSGEYSVRSLAEILREHGLESELGTRPGRRRKASDDPSATGRSARVETGSRADAPAAAPAQPARGATPPRAPAPARAQAPVWTPAPEPTLRPAAGLASPDTPVRAAPAPSRSPAAAPTPVAPRAPADPGPMSTTGPVGGRSDVALPPARQGRRKADAELADRVPEQPGALYGQRPSTSAIPAGGSTTASSTQHSRAAEAASRARRAAEHPVTGPIPVVTAQAAAEAAAAEAAEPLTGKESALAWARFAGELVVALAVGIGVYFLFTVLWELMPYVALVAAPLTVTGLVAGVAAWRQRMGQGQLGVRLLAVLLLAGTVLVIAPAAGLLASS